MKGYPHGNKTNPILRKVVLLAPEIIEYQYTNETNPYNDKSLNEGKLFNLQQKTRFTIYHLDPKLIEQTFLYGGKSVSKKSIHIVENDHSGITPNADLLYK